MLSLQEVYRPGVEEGMKKRAQEGNGGKIKSRKVEMEGR